MENLWAILVAAGVPSLVLGFMLQRYTRKVEKSEQQRKAQETAKKEFEKFQLDSLTAVMKLSEANAIALQNGKCNGETHAALEYMKSVKKDQRAFLTKQGLAHIFEEV
jgi:uncharacterized protein HemX